MRLNLLPCEHKNYNWLLCYCPDCKTTDRTRLEIAVANARKAAENALRSNPEVARFERLVDMGEVFGL